VSSGMAVTSSMTVISRTAFDTNILIYSIDLSEKDKHAISKRIVGVCSDLGGPIALQCLNEFFRAVTRKSLLSSTDAARVVNESLEAFRVVAVNEADLIEAIEIHREHRFQFFDCLILATALRAGCTILFSEDFQHNYTVDGITIVNPFKLSESELDVLLA